LKTIYGGIHMSAGVVKFTDEFIDRLRHLRILVQSQAGFMIDGKEWSESLSVDVHYGVRGGRGLAKYISGDELSETSVLVRVTESGCFPYSYHEEGQDSVMGGNAPSLEEAPDVFFSEDLLESVAYLSSGVEMMCRYNELGPLLAEMPPGHRQLFDEAVMRELEGDFDHYRESWLQSFEIITRVDIDKLRDPQTGYVSVGYDPAGAPDDVLARLKAAFDAARGHRDWTKGQELFALTSLPTRDSLEDMCRVHGLRFNHCALGLTPLEKASWCKSRGVKAFVDLDDEVGRALEGTGTKFISMRAKPVAPDGRPQEG